MKTTKDMLKTLREPNKYSKVPKVNMLFRTNTVMLRWSHLRQSWMTHLKIGKEQR
jgi:hypothetical protein